MFYDWLGSFKLNIYSDSEKSSDTAYKDITRDWMVNFWRASCTILKYNQSTRYEINTVTWSSHKMGTVAKTKVCKAPTDVNLRAILYSISSTATTE